MLWLKYISRFAIQSRVVNVGNKPWCGSLCKPVWSGPGPRNPIEDSYRAGWIAQPKSCHLIAW